MKLSYSLCGPDRKTDCDAETAYACLHRVLKGQLTHATIDLLWTDAQYGGETGDEARQEIADRTGGAILIWRTGSR